jgi:Spy/CpxP family protein refolding chaperone
MGNLERIADYANMIETRMKEGQELDSWMYSQLTVALENLNSVHDAMDGDDGEREPMKEVAAKSEGERIQNLNNRIKVLRDKLSATKSPEQKKLFQDRLKNALQSLSNIRRNH